MVSEGKFTRPLKNSGAQKEEIGTEIKNTNNYKMSVIVSSTKRKPSGAKKT